MGEQHVGTDMHFFHPLCRYRRCLAEVAKWAEVLWWDENVSYWHAGALAPPPLGCSFLNFTVTHDGIGVRPLEGFLSREDIDRGVATVRTCGGLVSSRKGEGEQEVPYEPNITYFDAMKDPDRPEDLYLQVLRFLCSLVILLADTETVTGRVFRAYSDLLAFHPDTPQQVIDSPETLFVVLRTPEFGKAVTCVHNVSGRKKQVPLVELGLVIPGRHMALDLIGEEKVKDALHLEPYQCCWLKVRD